MYKLQPPKNLIQEILQPIPIIKLISVLILDVEVQYNYGSKPKRLIPDSAPQISFDWNELFGEDQYP